MYRYFNPNPCGINTGDCTVRAICAATGMSWDMAFDELCDKAKEIGEMPSSNNAWGQYLQDLGFTYRPLPNTCPFCFSVKDFCKENPKGTFILGTGTHVVTAIDGNYYDAWDSGDEIIAYVWYLPH